MVEWTPMNSPNHTVLLCPWPCTYILRIRDDDGAMAGVDRPVAEPAAEGINAAMAEVASAFAWVLLRRWLAIMIEISVREFNPTSWISNQLKVFVCLFHSMFCHCWICIRSSFCCVDQSRSGPINNTNVITMSHTHTLSIGILFQFSEWPDG